MKKFNQCDIFFPSNGHLNSFPTGVTQSDKEDQLLFFLIEWVNSPGKIGKHLEQKQLKNVQGTTLGAVCYILK